MTKRLAEQLPSKFGTYVEPFLGSGAVFFELLPGTAVLNDANDALIQTYCAIRDHPSEISDRLRILHKTHRRETYYAQRESQPDDHISRAVRFIYLNRTCWNGLYRVNKRNEFNVPIGTKTSVFLDTDDFQSISVALQGIDIFSEDFQRSIDRAVRGDLIYVDPPYTVKHNLNGFLKYNQIMFSWNDQIRLHDSLVRARSRGCNIIASNADHESIRALYADFSLQTVPRVSVIAGDAGARGPTSEVLVVHHG